ncbi:MAG: magnesium-translocating P-type ATPase [Candidatus Micrarchaeia archaeon]
MLTKPDVSGTDLWSMPIEEAFARLKSSANGLSDAESSKRHAVFGLNELAQKKKRNLLMQFAAYFFNPLIVVLIIVGLASFYFGNALSAVIILIMVLVSVCLTFYQEYSAQDAAEKLRKLIRNTATALRNSKYKEVPLKYLAPGDVIRLSAGDLVPADCRIISCRDFFINQASITGESVPVEKTGKPADSGTQITDMLNAVFFGSSVVSGSAQAIVVRTGMATQFGAISARLGTSRQETAFDRGVRDYSMLMLKFVFVLVLIIFALNAFLKQNMLEALLFALAVAVGLTPEMLPMVVTANLSQGANNMAKKEVIVKKLPSIQNLGAMDVLCTDKTGTLTEDKIKLVRHVNIDGIEDDHVLLFAYLISFNQTGLRNPLDSAILEHDAKRLKKEISANFKKIDEIPFDFMRRCMSVVVEDSSKTHILLTKGAPEDLLPKCNHIVRSGSLEPMPDSDKKKANELYLKLSSEGFRVLALASKQISSSKSIYSVSDESDLAFEGFLAFLDPPKKTAHASLAELMKRGIEIKILSGDNELVNRKIAKDVGLNVKGVITGAQIAQATDESMQVLVEENTIFARVSPMQKERIILALQRNHHIVGYLGDGINDSLALKTSDVGISVDSAADVAKESADVILLRKSLHVLYEGVDEGRRTFANTMKYLKMGSSSNFGNMFSMVGASIFLPFLPMAPIQILLNNFLYDISQLGITSDNVDSESLAKPAQWSMDSIKNFMLYIGPVSSIFDYITFGVLFIVLNVPAAVFHTGWFIESILTQTLVVYVVRTGKIPFIQSKPSKKLLLVSLSIMLVAILIVTTPLREIFEFGELPLIYYPILIVIVLSYLVLTQLVKGFLIKRGIISY